MLIRLVSVTLMNANGNDVSNGAIDFSIGIFFNFILHMITVLKFFRTHFRQLETVFNLRKKNSIYSRFVDFCGF